MKTPGGIEIIVSAIDNSTPRPGLITWWDEHSYDYVVPGNTRIEVVKLA